MIESNTGSAGASGKEGPEEPSGNLDWNNSFSFMVVHELKTPIATIRAHAAYLRKYIARMKQNDIVRKVQIIEEQAVRMGSMLNEFLTFGQTVVPRIGVTRQRIDICTFFHGLKSEVECQCKQSHRINFAARLHGKELFTDQDLLRSIFTNLLGNAIKFSPGKTDVWLDACDAENGLVVTVRDEGLGIEEKEMSKIFAPFRRGSNAIGIPGTGLGLCIVKKSIEALEASIEVSSSPGRGSVFKVTIPTI